jgi:hypothetical protein
MNCSSQSVPRVLANMPQERADALAPADDARKGRGRWKRLRGKRFGGDVLRFEA